MSRWQSVNSNIPATPSVPVIVAPYQQEQQEVLQLRLPEPIRPQRWTGWWLEKTVALKILKSSSPELVDSLSAAHAKPKFIFTPNIKQDRKKKFTAAPTFGGSRRVSRPPKLADTKNIAFDNKHASRRYFYVNYWTKLHSPR